MLMASNTVRTVYFYLMFYGHASLRQEIKSRRYVFDAINTSEPVEVSREGGLSKPYQTLLVRVLILQAVTPCAKKAVRPCETTARHPFQLNELPLLRLIIACLVSYTSGLFRNHTKLQKRLNLSSHRILHWRLNFSQ